ncbi:MAG TPA: magnesium chelatase [Lentisphaeria bacterium]|nr:MAG: magnesium chelatase [Lentisphaerae bacterium GWF2_49_21]HBC86142.1 magnesium chelatase [Lentisphaeria bacterium]
MEKLEEIKTVLSEVKKEVSKVIIGQEQVVDLALVTIFSRAHALVEGVPGVAKTLLVRTLGKTMNCDFKRIQFTPDLMPSDITGTNVYNFHRQEFNLVRGPVFTTFLLADEINRAPAKTQSALLQCMQERKVTIDGEDYPLSGTFTVFATQNPIEYEGTYPLPEAEKDRFMLKIPMSYPDEGGEKELARRMMVNDSPEKTLEAGKVSQIIAMDKLFSFQESFAGFTIKEEIVDYLVKIVRLTRSHDSVLVGAGPRATQAFLIGSRVLAALNGRDFVTPDDVKFLAEPILGHRLVLRPEYEIEGLTVSEVIRRILEEVAIPR